MINPIPWIGTALVVLAGQWLLSLGKERIIALFGFGLFGCVIARLPGRWRLLAIPFLVVSYYYIIFRW